jgi:hypothetical protein
VYLSIASYRDPLLQSTIDSAFSNARFPEDLEVGCFIQIKEDDPDSVQHQITDTHQNRVHYEVAAAGKIFSVTYCRNRANTWLKPSHKYVLQVDSHTRFEKDWDQKLIEEQKNLSSKKVLLSSYLLGWVPLEGGIEFSQPHTPEHYSIATYNNKDAKNFFFDSYELVPNLKGGSRSSRSAVKSWYTCGHFLFGPADYFLQVQQPDWILFWGEELYHSLVAFTHGWDVYAPYSMPLRHMFPQDVPHLELNKIWKDFPDEWHGRRIDSTDKVIDAIIDKITGPDYLGTDRSLDELYGYLGYDLGELFESWRNEYRALH